MKKLNVSDNALAAIVAIVAFVLSIIVGLVAKGSSDDAGVIAGRAFLVGFVCLIISACVFWRREAVVHICNILGLIAGVLTVYFLIS